MEYSKIPTSIGLRMAVVSTVVVGAMATLVTPTLAHDERQYASFNCGFPPLSCGFGQVRDNHQIIDACDTRADGRVIVVDYVLRNGRSGSVRDPNGSRSGCGIQRVGATSAVSQFRVCDNSLGGGNSYVCFPWRSH